MEALKPVKLNLAKKFRKSRSYRHEFFRERAKDEIAIQIRELREKRKLRQVDFAKEANMKQSAVSRIEQADYSGWTFRTLMKVAETLDARLRIVFQPMEDVIREYEYKEQIHTYSGKELESVIGLVYDITEQRSQLGLNESPPLFAEVVRKHPTPPNRPYVDSVSKVEPKGFSSRITESTEQQGQPKWS